MLGVFLSQNTKFLVDKDRLYKTGYFTKYSNEINMFKDIDFHCHVLPIVDEYEIAQTFLNRHELKDPESHFLAQ